MRPNKEEEIEQELADLRRELEEILEMVRGKGDHLDDVEAREEVIRRLARALGLEECSGQSE